MLIIQNNSINGLFVSLNKNQVRIKKKKNRGVPVVAQQLTNPTSINEDMSLIPGLTQ